MLPKVELHLHLDCSLSYEVVHELRPNITRASYERDFVAPAKCTNLADFLTRAPHGFQLMQTERELRAVVRDVFQQLKADGVIYAEVRFAPLLHTAGGLKPEQVVSFVNDATEHAIEETGVEARLILCSLRHFNRGQSLATVELVDRFRGTKVVALDLAGDEAGYPISNHIQAYEIARSQNLFRTAHAGEASGSRSVWETLEHFAPTRIGHGVRSIDDSKLIAHLREQNIHLEVCPSSNLQTNVFDSIADHPIDRLFREGLPLSISTDARTITNITLEQEYAKVREAFSWSDAQFQQCNLKAIEASFIPEDLKKTLSVRLQNGQTS